MTNNEYDFCKAYMTYDEYILWKGKPDKGNLLTSRDLYMIPFSILWCGFAILWTLLTIKNAPFFFPVFGLIFVMIGLYMVFGRFIWTAYLRKRTFYVITNKKILRQRRNKTDILDSKNLPNMNVIMHKNGNGTIYFGQQEIYYRGGLKYLVDPAYLFSIENIPNVIQVQEIISNIQ